MKVTYIEEVENRTALSRKMYCMKCGSHIYNIHHQLQPEVANCWWIECDECGHESESAPTKKLAIEKWKW